MLAMRRSALNPAGLKDGQPIPEKDKTAIRSIVAGVFASDGVTDELVDTIIAERASRAGTYA